MKPLNNLDKSLIAGGILLIALGGCAALVDSGFGDRSAERVAEGIVKGCASTAEENRKAFKQKVLDSLPPGYHLDIDCPGDLIDD